MPDNSAGLGLPTIASRVVDVLAGVLLIAAALLKFYSPQEIATLQVAYHLPRWIVLAGIQLELALGVALLAGIVPHIFHRIALLTFVGFAAFSLYRLLSGHESCGCFGALLVPPWVTLPPGLCVATPGLQALELNRTAHCRGTSNATALATRHAARVFERLAELRDEPGGDQLDDRFLAVVIKCLLVHGATWGDKGALLDSVFRTVAESEHGSQNAWRELDRIKNALLGYGEVEAERAFFSNDERVTVIGWSSIQEDQGHVFRFPLPSALSGSNVVRRFTGTLAWFSSVNPQHRNYRQAYLWFNLPEAEAGVSRREVDADSSRRGTVEHRVLEGNRVVAFGEDDVLEITVSCKSDAGRLREPVPYALAATLEVAEPLEVSIFEQISNRVRQRIDLPSA
jgi:hypothetical protein